MAAYTYDQLDRVSLVTLANGTTVTPSFDGLNELSSVHNALNSGNRNYAYGYDTEGKATSCTEPRGTVSYGYTNRNELNSVTEPSGSPFADQSFTFDAAFNRSNWTLGSTSKNYTVNNLNQYTAIGTATPTWNSDGGLASYNGSSYTYDAMGRLTEADTSSNKSYYSYDPFGRRTQKVVKDATGTTTLSTISYHYDGSEMAVEYQGSTTWTYYPGLGTDVPVMRTDGTNKQWYYRDGLGSVSAVADNSGNLLEAYKYTAQGHCQITNGSGTVLSTTAIGNEILFAGREYDAETGNYYDRARYYSPVLGRFISRDPLSGAEFSQGTNLYAYCGNDPVNSIDPSGLADSKGGGVWEQIRTGWDIAIQEWVWVRGPGGAAQISDKGPNSLANSVGMFGDTFNAHEKGPWINPVMSSLYGLTLQIGINANLHLWYGNINAKRGVAISSDGTYGWYDTGGRRRIRERRFCWN